MDIPHTTYSLPDQRIGKPYIEKGNYCEKVSVLFLFRGQGFSLKERRLLKRENQRSGKNNLVYFLCLIFSFIREIRDIVCF